MRKRVDHDATQEVSSSQLVPDAKPPARPGAGNNDASMWMQAPVSADDFAGGPRKKKPPGRGGRTAVVGIFAVLLVATVAGGAWYVFLRESPAQTAAAPSAPAPTPAPVAADLADAGAVAAGADAAVVVDAAVPAIAVVDADAVSSAGKLFKRKQTTRRPTHKKKKATKKRSASKRRRR